MLKVSYFEGVQAGVPTVIPLFGPADPVFEKVASPQVLPEVLRFIDSLRPRDNAQYVLVNAMGASEYYSSNSNGDAFREASLIHCPDDWTGDPVLDRDKGKDWAYGFPTFYNAKAFAHHRNKVADRGLGDVELASWNPHMRRVELVVRVDRDRCQAFDGQGTWDKLKSGSYCDVSMGCVPAGTRVMLADGSYREMERMQEADLVLTHLGRERRVDQLHRYHYEGTLYRFKAYGFRRELCLTANHPLWLVRKTQLQCRPKSTSANPRKLDLAPRQRHCTPLVREVASGCGRCSSGPNYTFEWVRADETAVGDYVAFAVPEQIDTTITDAREAKFLGYYLAEGYVGDYNERPLEQITFSLGIEEKELAQEIEELARYLGATVLWHREEPARGARSVTVVSKRLADRCLHFCGAKAKTKRLSRELLYMAPGLQLSFLGAYLNGDGGTYKGSAYFSTASEQLAQQLFVALARCGLIASINEIKHRPSKKSVVQKETTEFQVWVGTDFSHLLAPYTYKPVRRSKKVRGQRFFYVYEGVRYIMSPITEIVEEDYDDDVFNISVAGDDSYIGELLATHNTRVPFDTCSICLDVPLYQEAWSTFDPHKHKSPGEAILEFHKRLIARQGSGIRGLSITRKDYCVHALREMNSIYPDGRKVFVWNDFPRFFDISFVFIGADKIAKVMLKIAEGGRRVFMGSAELAEKLGMAEEGGLEKAASLVVEAKQKKSEILKDVMPNHAAGKAVPLLSNGEQDLSDESMRLLKGQPLERALSTTAGMGMVLKPREFQELVLSALGQGDLAELLKETGKLFPASDESEPMGLSEDQFSPGLARALVGEMAGRSAYGPLIERRVLILAASPKNEGPPSSSHPEPVLNKIGAAYNGYRSQLIEMIAGAQGMLEKVAAKDTGELTNASPQDLFTPLSYQYLKYAFLAQVPGYLKAIDDKTVFAGALGRP